MAARFVADGKQDEARVFIFLIRVGDASRRLMNRRELIYMT